MFNKLKTKIKNFAIETKEKAEKTLDDTKETVTKLTESADKFISDSNNQMKVITVVAVAVGSAIVITSLVNMVTNIYAAKHSKANQITQNFYIYKGKSDGASNS